MKAFKNIIGFILILALVVGAMGFLFQGCVANQAYVLPDGCDGTDIINSLPTGTDLNTQTALMIFIVQEPDAKNEVINTLKEMKAHLQLNYTKMTNVDLYSLFYEALDTVNEKYKKIAIILTPQMKAVLGEPRFKLPNLLDICAVDRLVFWIDENVRNLERF